MARPPAKKKYTYTSTRTYENAYWITETFTLVIEGEPEPRIVHVDIDLQKIARTARTATLNKTGRAVRGAVTATVSQKTRRI